LANSADAAALQLSSNLSTKSRQLFEGLGGRVKKCYKTGFLSIVLAAVVAIVLIVVSFGTAAPAVGAWFTATLGGQMAGMMAVGAIGGALGGAAGGVIAGTGAGRGALTGAAVGAAIGGIAAGIAGATTGTVTSGGTVPSGGGTAVTNVMITGEPVATASGTMTLQAGAAIPAGSQVMAGTVATGFAGAGTIVTGGMSVGAGGYNEAERFRALDDYISEIEKMFGKATEHDRYTQTTIMRAMSGVVDDPNMSPDTNDSNYNNDFSELVSDYQVWWWQRANNIGKVDGNSIAAGLVTLDALRGFIGGLLGGGYGFLYVGADLFVSQEYMWQTDFTLPEDQWDGLFPGKDPEGLLPHCFRALESSGIDLSFWEPGPPYDVYEAAYAVVPDDDCAGAACDVPPPPGYDRFDMVVAMMHEVCTWIAALRQQSPDDLAATWDDWIFLVYDVAEDPLDDPAYNPYTTPPASLYGMVTLLMYEMNSWMTEIDALYPTWPPCQMDATGQFINAPCRVNIGSWGEDASFDAVPDYEYVQLKSWLQTWGPLIFDHLRSALKGLATFGYSGHEIPGGKNPATYEWNDARGRHRVRVKLGNFRIPRIVKKEYGDWLKGKTCMEMENYSDEWEFARRGTDENYVEISRYDQPSGQSAIGRWNPLNRSITKRAYYSYGYTWSDVHLRDKF